MYTLRDFLRFIKDICKIAFALPQCCIGADENRGFLMMYNFGNENGFLRRKLEMYSGKLAPPGERLATG